MIGSTNAPGIIPSSGSLANWLSGTTYAVGDCVIYEDRIYQCKTANADTTWTASKWTLLSDKLTAWVSGTSYKVGDTVIYDNRIYECLTANTDTTWTDSKWQKLSSDLLDWVSSTAYAVGDCVIHDKKIYKCTTANTDTAWTASHWQALSVELTDWLAGASYAVGDCVIYNNAIYQCKTANSDSVFTPAKWQVLGTPLEVATDLILGGVKSTTVEGGIKVNSDGTMEYNKPADVVDPIASTAWAPNTEYKANNIVGYEGNAYICLENHTSSNDFDTDYLQGYWSKVDMPKVGASGYAQVFVMGVTGATSSAPFVKSLAINPTNSFILPPVEVLEEAVAESAIINDLHFDNADATDFNYDSDFVKFDGTMHLKTEYDLDMSEIAPDSEINISNDINMNNVNAMPEFIDGMLSFLPMEHSVTDDKYNFGWTIYGNPTISTAQKVSGNSSMYLDGNSAIYMTNPITWDSSNSFTLSAMFYLTSRNSFTRFFGIKSSDSRYLDFIAEHTSNGGKIVYQTSYGGVFLKPNIYVNSNTWYRATMVKDKSQLKLYLNNTLICTVSAPNASLQFVIGGSFYQGAFPSDGSFHGYIDNVIVSSDAVYDLASEYPMNVAYLSNNKLYGQRNNQMQLLSNDYASMTIQQINNELLLNDGSCDISDLKSLSAPIKILTNNVYDNFHVGILPTPQTITPKGRIPLLKYNKIRQVTITGGTTGNGVVKIAVTKDNSTYQVYDTTNEEWEAIDIADIGTDGMSLTDVSALTSAEWIAYDCMDSGIGFAYYLEIASTSDTAYTDELSLNVELFGEMKSIIKGTDFDYSYPSNYVLQVKLYKNGDFRINYNPGPPSTTLDIPTVSRALEYNGTEQSAPISNYDSSKMSMIGTTAATNAGVYTVVITPNAGYEWSDLSTDPKTLTWTIIKAYSNLTLTPNTLTLAVGASDTIAAAFDGDGVLTAVPSDTNVSVTVSGNDIVVTGVAAGSDTVTASVSATDNWNADMATATITVS